MTAITDKYAQLGGEMGSLGIAIGGEASLANGGMFQHYANGSIYWTRATGAHMVSGAIRQRWAALRWERGLLGYPTSDPQTITRNREAITVSQFQHGTIEFNTVTEEVHVEKAPSVAAPNYEIPLVGYLAADDDGGRQVAITAAQMAQWVDEANRVFAAAGVRFVYDGVLTPLRNTDVNNVTGEGDVHWNEAKTTLNALATQRRAVVVVARWGPGTGAIGGGFSWWNIDFVGVSFFDAINRNSLSILAHELGHHFGLPHTHGVEFPTAREANDYVLSNRPVIDFDGDRDLIDDTPPDPFIPAFTTDFAMNGITLAGQPFAFARKNLMSYWNHAGTAELSHSQIDRVRQLVVERDRRYLNVRVVAPVECPALLRQIAAAEARLVELRAELGTAGDLSDRRRIAGAIARLSNDIRSQRDAARSYGCL